MKRLTRVNDKWSMYSAKLAGLTGVLSDNRESWLCYDTEKVSSACLRCADAPCISFTKNETEVSFLEVPRNPDTSVCPVDAIHQNSEGVPEVNHDVCISCDLCLCRCPVRAIQHDKRGKLKVVTSMNSDVFTPCSTEDQKKNLNRLKDVKLKILGTLDGKRLNSSVAKIRECCKSNPQLKNTFSRNLLICLGLRAQSGVTGDTNMRVDLLFESEEVAGISEVEFNAPVESPRDILDGFAVVSNRYDHSRSTLMSLILLDEFPNHRSDFYGMIDDIKNVLEVQIKVASITTLLALIWAGIKCTSDLKLFDSFRISHELPTIFPQMKKCIGEKSLTNIPKAYFEPRK
jgi:NAD-dependent dihydropyrimidine dehydrogenase PreA subunit